jgi:hypothetical protein
MKRPTVPAGIRHHIWRWFRHLPAFVGLCGQAQSQRGGQLGRLFGPRHQAPSARRWVRATASEPRESHGRTSRLPRPATRVPRGRYDLRGCSGSACRPAPAKWAAHAHSQGVGPVRAHWLLGASPQAHV